MRVWVYPEKKYEELGAVRWEVSWEELRKSAQGKEEIDHDADIVNRYVVFDTPENAMQYARRIVNEGKPFYGAATVTRQVVDWFVEEDRVAEWANTSDVEEVS